MILYVIIPLHTGIKILNIRKLNKYITLKNDIIDIMYTFFLNKEKSQEN